MNMHGTNEPICGNHNAPMKWKEGVSKKNGKEYAFWSCSMKMQDGSYCDYKTPWGTPGPSPDTKFVQSLDDSVKKEEAAAKDDKITRLAIAKSLIEAGKPFSTEVLTEAAKWVAWCEGKMPAAPTAPLEGYAYAPAQQPAQDEVDVSSIPF